MNPFTNRDVPAWLRLCADFEHSESFETTDVFKRIERRNKDLWDGLKGDDAALLRAFEDDKTEYELSDPRYIEQLLDDDMEAE